MGIGSRTPVFISVLFFAALIFLTAISDSIAQSRVCRNLQAQLSATPRGGGSSDASIRNQLSQAQRLANQKRCRVLFGQPSSECQSINAKINQLTNQLRSGGGGGGNAQKRQQIMAAMTANGCGKKATKKKVEREAPAKRQAAKPKASAKPKAAVAAKPKAAVAAKPKAKQQAPAKRQTATEPKAATVVKASTGAGSSRNLATSSRSSTVRKGTSSRSRGTYRTMCVRLSDGYYFPISFSVPEKFFERDAETCQSRCAGMDVELYTHRPGEDSEEMVSYPDEKPYSDLATAYIYRNASMVSQISTCKPALEETVEESPTEERPIMAFKGEVPIPTPRPSLEETSSISPETEEVQQISVIAGPMPDERKDVRAVGPKFLPDPSEELDLIGQARLLGL